MLKLKNFSFGATSAVITGLAIIIGLSGMANSNITITAALLIFALADNVSDSFGMHVYQRSRSMDGDRKATIMNFFTRIAVTISFIAFILLLPMGYAIAASISFGIAIIAIISYLIARDQKMDPYGAVARYVALAILVIIASFYLREIITHLVST